MITFVILACILESVVCFDNQEWEKYKTTYGKTYKTAAEDRSRLKIFLEKKSEIERHNELYAKKLTTYQMGVNRYTDMTAEELSVLARYQPNQQNEESSTPYVSQNLIIPSSIDWRNYGCVSPVQDQGVCGSCYAFAAVGALEGQHCKATGRLINLSEQQIVDCCGPYGIYGCQGGSMERAYLCISQMGGINLDVYYPYHGVEGTCKFNITCIGTTCSGYYYIRNSNENDLLNAVGTYGPIAVAIDVEASFHNYRNGVYYEPKCKPNFANHGVLVVGYGSENGMDYWLVKNSWGPYWGDSGYIKMSRNRGNNCNIASWPTWPKVP